MKTNGFCFLVEPKKTRNTVFLIEPAKIRYNDLLVDPTKTSGVNSFPPPGSEI